MNTERQSVAIIMLGIDDLSGGGGAERFFADVYTEYQKLTNPHFRLLFFCDEVTCNSLQEIGRVLPESNLCRVSGFDPFYIHSYWRLFRFIVKNRIKIIHIPLIAPQYLPFLWLLGLLPIPNRPVITMTQVDCGYIHKYKMQLNSLVSEEKKSHILHRTYFRTVKLGGILTWYRLFEQNIKPETIRGKPLIRSIRHYFVDTEKFTPSADRNNTIVWAGRFIVSKRPFLFVESVRRVVNSEPDICRGWTFCMYGKGPLKEAVKKLVNDLRLSAYIKVDDNPRMDEVFSHSRIFVSTQEYENFTSLAMLEAISCGNAVIAFNAGQTDYFVRQDKNGLLVHKIDPADLADAIIKLMKQNDLQVSFGRESRDMVLKYHTPDNFISELDLFWNDVINA